MSRRILLITPQFFGIENKIKSILEDQGYDVVWIENKTLFLDYHGTNSKCKLLRRIYFFLSSPQKRYLKSEFKKIEDQRFDILFAINGHVVNSQLFRILKNANRGLVSILYLWDSSGMYNWENELKFFDNCFTFDKLDSLKYKIDYKPNFYLKNHSAPGNEIDLFFVGKYSPDRQLLIDKIINQTLPEKISLYLKLVPSFKIFPHNNLIYKVFKALHLNNGWINKYMANYEAFEEITERPYITNEPVSYNDTQIRLLSSNVILDIPFENQSGYSHRVIEALANGRKVLTTNQGIVNEDFYNPVQVHILDPQSPELDINWIKEKTIFAPDKYFLNLELSLWLKSILDGAIIKSKG